MNAILHAMGQVKPVHFGNGRIVELAPDWDDEEKASTAIRKGWRIDRIMEEMMILLADGEMRRTDVIQALRSTRKAVTKAAEKLISDGHISSYEKRSASGHKLVFYCRNDPSSNVRFVKKNQVAVEIRVSEKIIRMVEGVLASGRSLSIEEVAREAGISRSSSGRALAFLLDNEKVTYTHREDAHPKTRFYRLAA